jgi:hypothetical protein
MVIQDGAINPGTTAATDLGSTSLRWKGIYSGLGNFSGNLTAGGNLTVSGTAAIAKDTTIGNGTASTSMATGALKVNGGIGATDQITAK